MLGAVYCIRAEGLARVKVGFSHKPLTRIHGMRTALPCSITVLAIGIGTRDDECRIHDAFGAQHVHGEWFEETPEIVAAVVALPPYRVAVPPPPQDFGGMLRYARRSLGLSQDDLAARTGVCAATIRRAERGLHMPGSGNLHQIAGVLGLSVDALLRARKERAA